MSSPGSALPGADLGWEAVPSIRVKSGHSLGGGGEGEQVEGCETLVKGTFGIRPF